MLKSRLRASLIMLCSLSCTAHVFAAETAAIEDTRASIEKWVETRRMISTLKADWAEEKELLQASVRLFEGELKQLEEKLGESNQGLTQADKELEEQKAREKSISETETRVAALVTDLERNALTLKNLLPGSLQEKVAPLYERVPEDPATTKESTGRRLAVVMAILNEVDKFNGAFHVESEIRKREDGTELSVDTLYLGLGQAYFTDAESTFVGVGIPTAEGWKWMAKPELATPIRLAIKTYRNEIPADFVKLPVEVQ